MGILEPELKLNVQNISDQYHEMPICLDAHLVEVKNKNSNN